MSVPPAQPNPSTRPAPTHVPAPSIPPAVLALLRCPVTKEPLRAESDATPGASAWLVNASGTHRYPVIDGVPVLIRREA
jgi:uncharacterized protein YbaR (Trm112 family)